MALSLSESQSEQTYYKRIEIPFLLLFSDKTQIFLYFSLFFFDEKNPNFIYTSHSLRKAISSISSLIFPEVLYFAFSYGFKLKIFL